MRHTLGSESFHRVSELYTNGIYKEKTGGSWHSEDSAFKAEQVVRMLKRHPEIPLTSICDIGCGSGGVISELSRRLDHSVTFVGYEVSPQAYELAISRQEQTARFVLGEAFADSKYMDVALILDVIEHVEDCFSFARHCASKARWKIYHIPLDVSASAIVRGKNCWDSVGHLHFFSLETALKTIEHCRQEVIDWFLTPVALLRPHRRSTRWTNIARALLPDVVGARLLGGYSLMVLAR